MPKVDDLSKPNVLKHEAASKLSSYHLKMKKKLTFETHILLVSQRSKANPLYILV